jgi:hypothetical protein
LIFLVVLVPSAQFAWRNRDMPRFAALSDDGFFFLAAKSVAANHYRIESLPEQPFQTKYPPLYPLYLSVVWRLNPHFPDNLRMASFLIWLLIPILMALAWTYYRRNGFSEGRSWLMLALLGINPYLVLFGSIMFADVFFTCWVLAALLCVSKEGTRSAIMGGVLAGMAYLARTAGIALLVSVPAYLLWKRQFRRAAGFAAAMLPAVICWMLWTHAHRYSGADVTLIYQTDYSRYEFMNVGLDNLGLVLWKNFVQLIYGAGALILPDLSERGAVRVLTEVLGVGALLGTVRLARRGVALDYALLALVSASILLVWHFPPTARFLLHLCPLLLAGLIAEIEHMGALLAAAFRGRNAGERLLAGVLATGMVVVFGGVLTVQTYATFSYMNELGQGIAAKLQEQRAAYAWIATNLPPSATVLSYDDPLLYLYTGRRGSSLSLLPRWWYSHDHKAIVDAYRHIVEYCRTRGIQYVYSRDDDGNREIEPGDQREIRCVVRANPGLQPIFQAGNGTVYAIKPRKW